MFNKSDKFIDVRFMSNKMFLVQLLKLIGYIQYTLDNNNGKEETVLTIRIKNKYKTKLLHSINDESRPSLPPPTEIILGE